MANSEPNFNIDAKSVQEDEWVIYLKILTGAFTSMLSSPPSNYLKHDVLLYFKAAIGFTYLMMLIRLNGSNYCTV